MVSLYATLLVVENIHWISMNVPSPSKNTDHPRDGNSFKWFNKKIKTHDKNNSILGQALQLSRDNVFLDRKGPFRSRLWLWRMWAFLKLWSALAVTWVIKTKTICYIICCISSHHPQLFNFTRCQHFQATRRETFSEWFEFTNQNGKSFLPVYSC